MRITIGKPVEISRLRAWLSLVVDEKDARNVKLLPNLDFRFVCGNSLVPLPETGLQLDFNDNTETEKRLKLLRQGYYSETNPVAKNEQRITYYFLTLDERELESRYSNDYGAGFVKSFAQEHKINLDVDNDTDRFREYKKWRPFDLMESSPWYDSDEMFGIHPGFDAVIGNPPYIHLEDMKGLSKNLYQPLGYQSYEARGDIYALFYERGIQLLKDSGVLCYITSNKWMRAAYGGSLREFFSSQTNPVQLIDFAGQKIFDATVDTNILVLRRESNCLETQATIVKEDCTNKLSDYVKQNHTVSAFEDSGSWVILSDIERRIKEKIEAVGVPLKDWDIKINRGILTGCNEAFIIDGTTKDRLIAEDPRSAEIIRPILRGRDIKRYSYTFADKWIIALFPSRHYDIEDYPAVKAWLLSAEWSNEVPSGCGQLKLEQTGAKHEVDGYKFTARKKTGNKWFETQDQIGYWDDFSKQKIMYPNMTKYIPFFLDTLGFCSNDKSFMITCSTPEYLVAFLNSSLFKYCFIDDFPELQGGTRELRKVFFEQIQVKCPDDSIVSKLGPLVATMQDANVAMDNKQSIAREIDDVLFDFYELTNEEKTTIGFIDIL